MNPTISHVVIYSHGFGVRKSDRGLFTAISTAMPDLESILFDYNVINKKSNTLTAATFEEQTRKLRKTINAARAEHPGAVIDLVCHGQGCVVAALLKPRGIRKVIMLAPPDDMSPETVAKQLASQTEAAIDSVVTTRIPRADGRTTVIEPEYWRELADIDPVKLYNRLARFTTLRIMNAKEDELLGEVAFEGIDSSISLVRLQGGHNFDDEESRKRILYILQKELSL